MKHKKPQNNQSEQQEKKRIQKHEDSLSSFWDNFKPSNIHIIGVPEGEEKEQEIRNVFEKLVKGNFPNLMKEIDMQVHKAQSPKQHGHKEDTPRHIIIKMPKVKDKERILKAGRENQLITYMGVPIRLKVMGV